jgi:hypothetical protein
MATSEHGMPWANRNLQLDNGGMDQLVLPCTDMCNEEEGEARDNPGYVGIEQILLLVPL